MVELVIPIIIFFVATAFSLSYIARFKVYQNSAPKDRSFWNNTYIFDAIPAIFPTLGIFCTALGITIGIWNFNTSDIQNSIPQLLGGLRIAFLATMFGILGLIIFQKYVAIVQKSIDDNPNRPKRETDELSAIGELTLALTTMDIQNQKQGDKLIYAIESALEAKVSTRLVGIQKEIVNQQHALEGFRLSTEKSLAAFSQNQVETAGRLLSVLERQIALETKNGIKAAANAEEITRTMKMNAEATSRKFDEFSSLLSKNNTEALVEVMRHTTTQFNAQMSELIDRLVKENFKELNASVNTLNNWQKENKEQVKSLTENFANTHETFAISANTLAEVSTHTKSLVKDNGKLGNLVRSLQKVLIDDVKFQGIIDKLTNTIETLSKTTDSFDETTSKLNDWVKTERSFKDSALILIAKLEEFRDFNGDVWDKYRKEMSKAVSIVKETSTSLNENLENVNAEFYERLNDTLTNLDLCIQRFIPEKARA